MAFQLFNIILPFDCISVWTIW